MGYDCFSYPSEGTRKQDIEEFLTMLGYEKLRRGSTLIGQMATPFFFYKDEDYHYVTGVHAFVYKNDDGQLMVHTRTSIWRSKYDSDFHNFTIKQLKKRFGGYFRSDWGKGRYLQYNEPVRERAEAGCYLAFRHFKSSIQRLQMYLELRNFDEIGFPDGKEYEFLQAFNPIRISNNMTLPFLVAILEDYFRSTYVALLKYSPNKLAVFKSIRIAPEELYAISSGELSVEDAVARWMSFQDINYVCRHFRQVDRTLDIGGALRRPYRRRKESIYKTIERITKQRHQFIHQSEIDPAYTEKLVKRDVETVETGIERVYEHIATHYNWPFDP